MARPLDFGFERSQITASLRLGLPPGSALKRGLGWHTERPATKINLNYARTPTGQPTLPPDLPSRRSLSQGHIARQREPGLENWPKAEYPRLLRLFCWSTHCNHSM